MIEYYKDKNNHPMYGENHSKKVLKLISRPGSLLYTIEVIVKKLRKLWL